MQPIARKEQSILYLYDDQFGGYGFFGSRLGDYRRGLRIIAFLMTVLVADYMDVLASPAHDHNLYLLVFGQPKITETQTHHLLQQARAIAEAKGDQNHDRRRNPNGFFRDEPSHGFAMYEAVLLQTQCGALFAQGKR